MAIPAFRWKDGKIFALSVGGNTETNTEYLYLHIQKRTMMFTPGLENEDSFMIIPNEFVKDHALTNDEIASLMTPDPDYERAIAARYRVPIHKPSILQRIKTLIKRFVGNDPDKILKLKMLWNRLLRRKLPSRY